MDNSIVRYERLKAEALVKSDAVEAWALAEGLSKEKAIELGKQVYYKEVTSNSLNELLKKEKTNVNFDMKSIVIGAIVGSILMRLLIRRA